MRSETIDTILKKSLSPQRLEKYLAASAGDLRTALDLYERNTRLSEAFYTPLQSMEICLRNKLHDELVARYGPDWFRAGMAPLYPDAVEAIRKIVAGLDQARRPSGPGPIVAELSFGFWVGLLGPRYDATVWRQALYRAFEEDGRRLKRDRVHGRFNALRRLRNRIAHHEPIFHYDLPNAHAEIIAAISWMCPSTAAWTTRHSRFPGVFAAT